MERELELGSRGRGSRAPPAPAAPRGRRRLRASPPGTAIELERRPEAARALLGEDAWELLRPDRPEPEDRHGPGVPRERVAAVIERVESL